MKKAIQAITKFLKSNYKLSMITFIIFFLTFITLLATLGLKIGVVLVGLLTVINLLWVLWSGTRVIQDIRSGRILKGIEDIAIVLLTLAILVTLYIIASNRSVRIDLTSEKIFSLSPFTYDVISKINKEIKIILFSKRGEAVQLEKILEEYSKSSDKILFSVIDPIKDPISAKKYNIPQGETVMIVIESGENRKYIRGSSLVEYEQTSYGPRATGIKVEEEVTSAILNVSETTRKIYFLKGNGEYNVLSETPGLKEEMTFSTFKDYLAKANFEIKELDLSTTTTIPSDAGAIVIMSPRKFVSIEIQNKLYEYYKKGGGILLFLEPVVGNPTYDSSFSINYLLNKVGLYVKNNIVFDAERFNPYVGRLYYVFPYVHFSPVTSEIKNKSLPVQVITAMSIGKFEGKEVLGLRYYELLSTSGESWGETSLVGQNIKAIKDEKDITPPVILGYAIESLPPEEESKQSEEGKQQDIPKGRFVVIGDIDFLSDHGIESSPGNLDLALNSVEWVVGKGSKISIRPKSIANQPIIISSADANLVLIISLILLPSLMIITGLITWAIRSKKVV